MKDFRQDFREWTFVFNLDSGGSFSWVSKLNFVRGNLFQLGFRQKVCSWEFVRDWKSLTLETYSQIQLCACKLNLSPKLISEFPRKICPQKDLLSTESLEFVRRNLFSQTQTLKVCGWSEISAEVFVRIKSISKLKLYRRRKVFCGRFRRWKFFPNWTLSSEKIEKVCEEFIGRELCSGQMNRSRNWNRFNRCTQPRSAEKFNFNIESFTNQTNSRENEKWKFQRRTQNKSCAKNNSETGNVWKIFWRDNFELVESRCQGQRTNIGDEK